MTPDSQPQQLLIRCPSCATRFEVEEEMRGRLVECGECGHEFEILGPELQSGKEFFPGERQDPFLARLKKVTTPLPNVDDKNVPAEFASHTKALHREPATPLKVLMGAIAVFVMLVTTLFFFIGSRTGGVLDGVAFEKQLLLAGFAALMSLLMLVYANPRFWPICLLASAALGSLPFLLEGSLFQKSVPSAIVEEEDLDAVEEPPQLMTIEELRDWIGTEPLEKERERLLVKGSTKTALGLWLCNLESQHAQLVKDHVIRVMGASPDTHYYEREDSNYLLVVSMVDGNLDALDKAASPLGDIRSIHPELGVVEVQVMNERFEALPREKLTDNQNSEFYLANAIELRSIEPTRAAEALRRLTQVEPILLQEDISERMIELLESRWFEQKAEAAKGLLVWAKADGQAGMAALQQALQLRTQDQAVPSELVLLCIKQNTWEVLPLLHELWKENPSAWEPYLRMGGAKSERILLQGYAETTGALRQSASRLLGEVGGESSLLVLRPQADRAENPETRIICQQSIQMIEDRLKRRGSR